jgi:acyl-homoserine-lactone acylase
MNVRRLIMTALSVATLSLAPAPDAVAATADEWTRCRERAARVEILRDGWGIAHVYGESDADAVFGLLYAQAEDDLPRIEMNYLGVLGRVAEVEGESALSRDLRARLFVNEDTLRAQYAASPAWLRALMDAFADGLNWYLHTHPAVKLKLLTRFEPWMALAFTEGSIGGDIESIALGPLESFYGSKVLKTAALPANALTEPVGSNGFAIAPSRSASGHALLLINPHTSFYFRPEIHVVSREGLNAYGAVTWGQFFVYQGFNDRCGWMHTSGGADVIDEYREPVRRTADGRVFQRYSDGERELRRSPITLRYRTDAGLKTRTLDAWFSDHGPIIRAEGDAWIAVKLMQEPVGALMQSYLRTKARHYREFREVMNLRTNSSNNTIYADADGSIAFFHGNFVPRRDPRFDWSRPVDGSDPATEWRGKHEVEELITLLNPASGWIQNTNNWPFSAAGSASPRRADYPEYLWRSPNPAYAAENPRGINAVRVLEREKRFTLESLIRAAYDPKLAAFETLLPPLFAAHAALPEGDARRKMLAEPIAALAGWDHDCGVASVPAALAILWGQELAATFGATIKARGALVHEFLADQINAEDRLSALERVVTRLQRDFGAWQTPWGEINRFQRLTGDIRETYDDARPSLPVGFAPSAWGSLAAFGNTGVTPTRRIYGNRGNSFVAVVEFGPRIRAQSVLAGGVSGDPRSPHFNDQAAMYAAGKFKDVAFYREDVERVAQRRYRPGQ